MKRRAQHWTVTLVYQLSPLQVWCPDYDMLYPINKLRNEALWAAKAGLVFLVDVDFIPSVGLYATLCP
eukprot:3908685-Alexandrium_andersonii.AAC.1